MPVPTTIADLSTTAASNGPAATETISTGDDYIRALSSIVKRVATGADALTTPQINDTSSDHQYVVAVNELAADRTVTLPLLTGNDEFVFKDHAVTLTNKTLTAPAINGTVTTTGLTLPALTLGGAVTGNSQNITGLTTLDSTNVEVTALKAKDGTACATIADTTGVITIASSVLTTADINGGTIDGAVIGGASAAAGTFTTLNSTGSATLGDDPATDTHTVNGTLTVKNTGAGNSFLVEDSASTDSTPFVIDASGNTGIGTSTPNSTTKLHVMNANVAYGSQGNVMFVTSDAQGADVGAWLGLGGALTTASPTSIPANNRLFGAIAGKKENGTDANTAGYLEFLTMGTGTATPTVRMRITSDGRIYGTALHNNAGAVTGTTNQYIASGTYTPTLTNVTNVSSSTPYVAQWMRVGNVVTVSGGFTVTPTAAGGAQTTVGISLPIASALTNALGSVELSGAANAWNFSANNVAPYLYGDGTNNRAAVDLYVAYTSAYTVYFSLTYTVL